MGTTTTTPTPTTTTTTTPTPTTTTTTTTPTPTTKYTPCIVDMKPKKVKSIWGYYGPHSRKTHWVLKELSHNFKKYYIEGIKVSRNNVWQFVPAGKISHKKWIVKGKGNYMGLVVEYRCKGKSIKKTLFSKLWRRRWYTRTYKINGSDKVLSMLPISKSRACAYKKSIGFYGKKVWVRKGCRGVFRICIDPKGKKKNKYEKKPFYVHKWLPKYVKQVLTPFRIGFWRYSYKSFGQEKTVVIFKTRKGRKINLKPLAGKLYFIKKSNSRNPTVPTQIEYGNPNHPVLMWTYYKTKVLVRACKQKTTTTTTTTPTTTTTTTTPTPTTKYTPCIVDMKPK